jgi:hypothetical protein
VAILSIACAAGTGSTSHPAQGSTDRVTSAEIDATSATNAYDLVNRLRPQWLRQAATGSIAGGRVSSQVIVVYLDGNRFGTIESLRTLSTSGIRSMEWLSATRAAIILRDVGSEPIAGAISISTKK